jgi:hypothetical protein
MKGNKLSERADWGIGSCSLERERADRTEGAAFRARLRATLALICPHGDHESTQGRGLSVALSQSGSKGDPQRS